MIKTLILFSSAAILAGQVVYNPFTRRLDFGGGATGATGPPGPIMDINALPVGVPLTADKMAFYSVAGAANQAALLSAFPFAVGPASSGNTAIATWNGATGKLLASALLRITTRTISTAVTDNALVLSGGSPATVDGAYIQLFGSTHATKPRTAEILIGTGAAECLNIMTDPTYVSLFKVCGNGAITGANLSLTSLKIPTLTSGAARFAADGTLEKVTGTATDCVLVNGTSGACGSGGGGGIPTYANVAALPLTCAAGSYGHVLTEPIDKNPYKCAPANTWNPGGYTSSTGAFDFSTTAGVMDPVYAAWDMRVRKMETYFDIKNATEPAAPAAEYIRVWRDPVSGNIYTKTPAGVVGGLGGGVHNQIERVQWSFANRTAAGSTAIADGWTGTPAAAATASGSLAIAGVAFDDTTDFLAQQVFVLPSDYVSTQPITLLLLGYPVTAALANGDTTFRVDSICLAAGESIFTAPTTGTPVTTSVTASASTSTIFSWTLTVPNTDCATKKTLAFRLTRDRTDASVHSILAAKAVLQYTVNR